MPHQRCWKALIPLEPPSSTNVGPDNSDSQFWSRQFRQPILLTCPQLVHLRVYSFSRPTLGPCCCPGKTFPWACWSSSTSHSPAPRSWHCSRALVLPAGCRCRWRTCLVCSELLNKNCKEMFYENAVRSIKHQNAATNRHYTLQSQQMIEDFSVEYVHACHLFKQWSWTMGHSFTFTWFFILLITLQ